MLDRRCLALLPLLVVILAAPGCFATRAVGLGPDPGPNDPVAGDTPEQLYAKGQKAFESMEWKTAGKAFGKLWHDNPKSPLASDAQFYEAESRYGEGAYAGAFELYKKYV